MILVALARASECLGDAPQNVVLLLADDMRVDALAAMPLTTARMAGVELTRAYVTTPMCCPDRASMLSGGFYAHETGLLANEPPNGGPARFDDSRSLPVRLQEAGYATALIGKYLNGYEDLDPYLPPGWTLFAGWADDQAWWDFTLAEGSTGAASGAGERVDHPEYVTDHQRDRAVAFIEEHAGEPFFLYVPFLAPHYPHTPARQDLGSWDGWAWRGGAWNEEDVSDKPAWIQAIPAWDAERIAEADDANRERLETLAAMDRAVVAVMDALDASGVADRTLVIFTADNGDMWGEHRLNAKGVPYEESVRVPFIASHPALPAGTRDALVAANLEIGATIQDVAGIEARTSGQSLVPLLCDATAPGRDAVLLQGWNQDEPSFASVVTATHKYTEWTSGEIELYDLVADPYELENTGESPADLAAALDAARGLTIAADALPDGMTGVPYDATVPTWGGTEPFQFTAWDVPEGLVMDADGRLHGTPAAPGDARVRVVVRDSSVSPYHEGSLSVERELTLSVTRGPGTPEGRCGCGGGGAWVLVLLARRLRRVP